MNKYVSIFLTLLILLRATTGAPPDSKQLNVIETSSDTALNIQELQNEINRLNRQLAECTGVFDDDNRHDQFNMASTNPAPVETKFKSSIEIGGNEAQSDFVGQPESQIYFPNDEVFNKPEVSGVDSQSPSDSDVLVFPTDPSTVPEQVTDIVDDRINPSCILSLCGSG